MIIDFNRSWMTYPTPDPEEWHFPHTPREIDLVISRAARLVAMSINGAL